MSPIPQLLLIRGIINNNDGGASLYLPRGVYVAGNYAYVASSGSNALEIVDVTNPAAPYHKGSISDGTNGARLNGARSVYVSGNYAYVASAGSNALEIVDVTNPAAPVHRGSILDTGNPLGALLSNPQSVYVAGNYAYVASYGSNALEIVDVTTPTAPVHRGSIYNGQGGALLSSPQSVYVAGNYAYVASYGSNALEIVDVTNPAVPVHKGSLSNTLLQYPMDVAVSDSYAHVVGYRNALEIVDIGTVTATGVTVVSPNQITGTFDLNGKALGLYNVVVTKTDGSFGSLHNGFTIKFADAPIASFTANVPCPV